MSNIKDNINFVRGILPYHYQVIESKRKGSIHCSSTIGLPIHSKSDIEDEEQWGYIMKALRNKFKDNFQEVFHNTCFLHKDFTIYIKQ